MEGRNILFSLHVEATIIYIIFGIPNFFNARSDFEDGKIGQDGNKVIEKSRSTKNSQLCSF
jgi:hypothetical protein